MMIFSALLTSRWQTSPTEWHVVSEPSEPQMNQMSVSVGVWVRVI